MSSLTHEQSLLLNFYLEQYNQTQNQIRHLNCTLDELFHDIHSLTIHVYPNYMPLNHPIRAPSRTPSRTPSRVPSHTPSRVPTMSPISLNTTPPRIRRPNPIISPPTRNLYSYFYQPASQTPELMTPAQISECTRECFYHEIDDPINDSCPISLNAFNAQDIVTQLRSCGHIFNSSDISRWFENHTICPVCRHNLLSTNPESTNTQSFMELANQIIASIENSENVEYDASNNVLIFETLLNYRQR